MDISGLNQFNGNNISGRKDGGKGFLVFIAAGITASADEKKTQDNGQQQDG
jgi:hypothetical protein